MGESLLPCISQLTQYGWSSTGFLTVEFCGLTSLTTRPPTAWVDSLVKTIQSAALSSKYRCSCWTENRTQCTSNRELKRTQMQKKSRRFPSRLCMVYVSGRVECLCTQLVDLRAISKYSTHVRFTILYPTTGSWCQVSIYLGSLWKCRKRKHTDRFAFSSVEIDLGEMPREKLSRFAFVLFGKMCHLTHWYAVNNVRAPP